MLTLQLALTIASGICVLAAAILWLIAAALKVPRAFNTRLAPLYGVAPAPSSLFFADASAGFDALGAALVHQSQLNGTAAGFASAAAIFHAVALLA